MKEDHESCSTGSSLSGIYKNFFKSQNQPVCMFYFSHPFGISTPSSSNNADVKKKTKKGSKYTTTTYLVTEIQKNHSDGSNDELDVKKSAGFTDKDLLPWPKNFLLPPLIQLIEKKHGKKLPDIDAILRQVRKQAWNTPKSHHSHSFWSRGSSISSDDFSSLTSPDSLHERPFYTKKAKLKKKIKSSQTKTEKMSLNEKSSGSGNSGNGHGKPQVLLKRRYSVPEIIMRKYSLAQQKSYEESISIFSTTAPTSETIVSKRNGQSSPISINKKPIQSQTPSSRTASPIKYFIPLSPQPTSNVVSPTLSNGSCGGSGGFLHNHTTEISMRKQTLLRRMWSREYQHTKYSGSWSPPLRKSTSHNTQGRLKKFNTLPEFLSASCEKCRELGVLQRDDDYKEDKSQQTDFECDEQLEKQQQTLSSASSSASTIIQSTDVVGETKELTTAKNKSVESQTTQSSIKNSSASSITDANGNSIIICMTALQEQQAHESEDMLQVEIDGNNNSNNSASTDDIVKNGDKYLKKQFSTQLEDEGYHPSDEQTTINYRRLREDKLSDTEIDQYISQMLIDNLNNVIKTVNENLQANGEHNLVKIDYSNHHQPHPPSSAEYENVLFNNKNNSNSNNYNNKLRNQHEIAIQMRNAKNGDSSKNRNSNDSMSPTSYTLAVDNDICENADVNSPKLDLNRQRHFYKSYVDSKSVSETSADTPDKQSEVTAIINTGTSYPLPNRPETILVPRIIGPKTESMEVNPSTSAEDDELDEMPDSGSELLSDVDSLDDFVTIRAKKLNELAQQQHKKAQALFRQTQLKGQAFFVPIVDSDQPIDEHIVVADTMPEKLKERLVLRQRRRDMKKQSEMKIKQWKMQRFIERKMEQMNVVNDYLADLSTTGGAFKIIGMHSKSTPIETNVYKRTSTNHQSTGWVPKQRTAPPTAQQQQQHQQQQAQAHSNETPVSEKSSSKSKKLRNEIGMLESYKIDARGNMQIQAPTKKEKEKPPKPKIKRTSYTSISDGKRSSKSTKLKTPSENVQRKSVPSSKRIPSNIPTSSGSSADIDARRRQIMKDVQQMSVYKNDLTPDPDSGPSRKMWKTEIQEGDKHIEILEIVECVDGNTLAQQAPDNNDFNHLFTSPPSINSQNHHKFYHLPSSSSTIPHSMFVNKTFSVKTSGFDDTGSSKHYASRIPVPVCRPIRHYRQQPFMNYELRDSSPSNNFSSSTDAEESLTSASSSINQQHASKVDRMIANLLMEALKSPEDHLGVEFINSPKARRMKRRSQSPGGAADSSSTGYYTGDSSSRRSASNSAGKYQHRFEVIPEEKSSFSVDSSNDDFIEDEEEDENARNEKINNINNDWKSKKNLQNNDIKTRNITPQRQSHSENEEEEDKENADGMEEDGEKSRASKIPSAVKTPIKIAITSHVNNSDNTLKVSSLPVRSSKLSPARSPARTPIKSIKPIGADTSQSINASPSKKKEMGVMDVKSPAIATPIKNSSETKSFVMFTDENGNEKDAEHNVMNDECEKSLKGNEASLEQHTVEDPYHIEHGHKTSAHHFINHNMTKSSTPSSSTNNHFHYHVYQYQTNHCCLNIPDHSKSSSTVTTATSMNDNCCHTHFTDKSCPLGISDVSLSLNTPQLKETEVFKSANYENENQTVPNSSGSEFPSTVNDAQNKLNYPSIGNDTPLSSCNDTSRQQTADEKIIQIELTDENSQEPQKDRDSDTCSCTKKYLPYRINETNVWQVYETSECKYIQSKHEIDQIYQPPDSSDTTSCNLLHSRSNFSNHIVCHAINHESSHNDNAPPSKTESVNKNDNSYTQKSSTTDSIYTPTFNIKPASLDTCQCNIKDTYDDCKTNHMSYHEENQNENESKAGDDSNDDDDESVIISNQSLSTLPFAGRETTTAMKTTTGKLLNRPKATNNISRDQVKPVEKEIEKEITQNGMKGSSNTNAFKTSSKPIRLPSPNIKQQQQRTSPPKRNNSYEDNSNESSTSTDSQCESPKHESKQNSGIDETPKRKPKTTREKRLLQQENKSVVIPSIHQAPTGWSVTVAGTHPDLAPDVEMKISFPKPKISNPAVSVGPSEVSISETQKSDNETFFYKNNQLLPVPATDMNHPSVNPMSYEPKQYYNHRRSLSLARIDSGMSGMVKPKSYNLPNLHVPRPTARNAFKRVECTTISASKTIIPSRRSLSLDVGSNNRRRMSYDSRGQASPFTPSEMLSVVGSEIKKTIKPKVKTMSERDLTKRHLNCFTRNNGHMF